MGTNYYLRLGICDSCSRHDEFHIGKSSYGWKFMFRAYEKINAFYNTEALCLGLDKIISYQDWLKAFDKARIFDEYGDEVSKEHLIELIQSKQSDKYDFESYDYEPIHRTFVDKNDYKDPEGYCFCIREFL